MLLDLQKIHTLRIEVRVLILPRIRYRPHDYAISEGSAQSISSSSGYHFKSPVFGGIPSILS